MKDLKYIHQTKEIDIKSMKTIEANIEVLKEKYSNQIVNYVLNCYYDDMISISTAEYNLLNQYINPKDHEIESASDLIEAINSLSVEDQGILTYAIKSGTEYKAYDIINRHKFLIEILSDKEMFDILGFDT